MSSVNFNNLAEIVICIGCLVLFVVRVRGINPITWPFYWLKDAYVWNNGKSRKSGVPWVLGLSSSDDEVAYIRALKDESHVLKVFVPKIVKDAEANK